MHKVILSVAPVSNATTNLDPKAIAEDVIASYHAGASMVHLHSRDRNGLLVADTALLADTVALIRAQCPIVIEISTGGVSSLTIEQRCQTCLPDWVECNSLNVGSVNLGEAVYQNPIREVRYCVEQILQHGKIPEIEVFEIGMMDTARVLAQTYPFVSPLFFALVLGHPGAMPASVGALDLMLRGLRAFFPNPGQVLWGITEAHRTNWSLIREALERGADAVRIGFEDSDWLSPDVRAESNAQLVTELASFVRAAGAWPATPAETRAMLKIPQRR